MTKYAQKARARLANILRAARTEGLYEYARRILLLGRYRYLLRRTLFRHRLKNRSVLIDGVRLALPASRQKGIAEELLLYGTHEPVASALYREILRPGMSVLDVGANIGYYLAVASACIGKSGRILAVEPDPELFRLARSNSEGMEARVDLLHAAVSDRDGEADFYPSQISNWGSLRKDSALEQLPPVRIPTLTIDTLCDRFRFEPDVIRMDIEGFEAGALAGAARTLGRGPALFIELHSYVLAEEDVDLILSRLHPYRRFVLLNRYYDWPYSLPAARRRSRWELDAEQLREFLTGPGAPPVITLFTRKL